MSVLQNKIDFVAFISVEHANPNGDPLAGNRPRDTVEGLGEISDVCIKRKIRNRLQDMGEPIFVKSNDRCDDGCASLKDRAENCSKLKELLKGKNTDGELYAKAACEEWTDVRAFGQVFAFKGKGKSDGVSVGIRGPVTIHPAFSLSSVEIESIQITKSVNGESQGGGKSSDTMGTKHRVKFGIYELKGSINCQLAEKTGFTEEDAEKIKTAVATLFENDCSSARPEGSMCIEKLFWFKHNNKTGQYPTAKVHRSVIVKPLCDEPKAASDYTFMYDNSLEGLEPEVI